MTLPDSLVATGNENDSYAIFSGCTSLTDLTIGSGIAEVTKFFVPVASTNAFTVTVNGSGATVIDCTAFKNTKVGRVVLNGVASIEGTSSSNEGAFLGCSPLVRTEGVTLKILSTTDLADWSNPEERTLTVGGNDSLIFNHESDPKRFYKLKAE